MPENARIAKLNSVNNASQQNEESRSSRKQQKRNSNAWERRTRSISQEPVDPEEEAMDIAIGDEGKPWVRRKKVA